MDALNPMVPIQPTAPRPPDSTRVTRVERDQQREPDPDWQQAPGDGSGHRHEQDYEDDYDPDWGRWLTEQAASDGDDDQEPPGPHIDITV
jgi:hypothetical protein